MVVNYAMPRDQLEAYTSPVCQPPPHLTVTSVSPPHLTSDLLHVEECLQSRVRLLEREKKQGSLQLLELEKSLAEQKRQYHTLMETLRKEHEEAMYKVQRSSGAKLRTSKDIGCSLC